MSELDTLKSQARIIQAQLKNLRKEIDDAETVVNNLQLQEKELEGHFEASVHKLYKERHQIQAGDIMVCDEEQYKFVRFDGLSESPIVNYKLLSCKWSKKEWTLFMYDWKTQSTMTLGKIKL